MSYSATAINVMIASPGDVPQERVIARNVIHEWNTIHAKDRQVVLMPVGWDTHSAPDTGDRPQAIINSQLLRDADLLVAVFWTRLGSPTGVAASGTVEEIEEHLGAGKPAMIYFSSAPVRPDSIANEQYTALKAFKDSLRSRGLYSEYESLGEFKDTFTRHLAQTVIAKFASSQGTSDNEIDSSPNLPALSPGARELLIEISKDSQGVVMSLQMMNGTSVQTNGRSFVEGGNSRSGARWRGAVEELSRTGLVEDRGGKREVYFITDEGYRVAELLDTEIISTNPVPQETIRVVQDKKHSRWSMGSTGDRKPLMIVNFYGSITEISGKTIRVVAAEIPKPSAQAEIIVICNNHTGVRPQMLCPHETADISLMFTIPPVGEYEADGSWKSSILLVDQFGNRHKVPDCVFHSDMLKDKSQASAATPA